MNKRLGKWQVGVGVFIMLVGLLAIAIQPIVAALVVAYGSYIVYIGTKIKKGKHTLQKEKEIK